MFDTRRPPPRLLWEEEETLTQALIKEFLSPLSEEEMDCEMSEEEDQAFHEAMERWMNERASEELKLFWEYGKWIGDEGQLCDGKGNYYYGPKKALHFLEQTDPESFQIYTKALREFKTVKWFCLCCLFFL